MSLGQVHTRAGSPGGSTGGWLGTAEHMHSTEMGTQERKNTRNVEVELGFEKAAVF